jgi:ribosomal protein L32E
LQKKEDETEPDMTLHGKKIFHGENNRRRKWGWGHKVGVAIYVMKKKCKNSNPNISVDFLIVDTREQRKLNKTKPKSRIGDNKGEKERQDVCTIR